MGIVYSKDGAGRSSAPVHTATQQNRIRAIEPCPFSIPPLYYKLSNQPTPILDLTRSRYHPRAIKQSTGAVNGETMSIFSRRQKAGKAVQNESPAPKTVQTGKTDSQINPEVEKAILEYGSQFLDIARSKTAGILSAQFWSDKLMDWAMKDEAFKIQFFRFVDTYPVLKTPDQIHDHLVDFMNQPGVSPPPGMDLMTKAGGLAKGVFTNRMTKQITSMAQKFIIGSDAASAVPDLRTMWKHNIAFTVDLLGEACVSQRVADSYQAKYLDLVENLPSRVADFPANTRLETDHIGPIPRVNVSIKITSLYWDVDPINTRGSIAAIMERLGPILESAGRNNVLINFDIEQAEFTDLTLDLFEACCEKYDFPAGLALQAYLRRGPEDAQRMINWSKALGRQITVRLVKGAYWDYETINAEQQRWPVPVWSQKSDTDACFERMTEMILEKTPRNVGEGGVKLALGSHNARSIAHALVTARQNDLPDSAVEMQMLHGMGDPLKHASAELGLRLREYAPVGELLVGMAYFVRRLLENTSNESWLRAGFADNASAEILLADPRTLERSDEDPGEKMIRQAPQRHKLSESFESIENGEPFFNEPLRDFADPIQHEKIAKAVNEASPNPPDQSSSTEEAVSAIADHYTKRWSKTTVEQRAQLMVRMADQLRKNRDQLAGRIVQQIGMTWRDADAEVCHAIDICSWTARQTMSTATEQRYGQFLGEKNNAHSAPIGPALAVTPWNTPLAGLTTMATSALAGGNTVLIVPPKPATAIANQWLALIHEIDPSLTRDAVRIISTDQPETISQLANDPRFRIILQSRPTEINLDSVIQKHNLTYDFAATSTFVIDASADLNEAVMAVRDSAFGFQGQRFGSCRTVLAVDTAFDAVLQTLSEATAEMRIGNPIDPATGIGPIIDAAHATHIEKAFSETNSKSVLLMSLPEKAQLAENRQYITPHIYTNLSPENAQSIAHLLGPVVNIIRIPSFDDALKMMSETIGYRHIGAVFARKPSHIQRAAEEMHVGSLQINRGTSTGMLKVARQGIGITTTAGFNTFIGLPGHGTPTITRPAITCENTMRRGFAPDLD